MQTIEKKMSSLVIIGRRWFRRTYGNTYTSVEIGIDGRHAAKLGPTGGYGDHYEQMAVEWLQANGFIPAGTFGHLRIWCEENGVTLVRSVHDVPRQKDL